VQKIETVYENQNFIAVDKPGGWLSVPSRMGREDARPCLVTFFKERVWPVHRLDFEVSGLVLFAKTAEAHRFANGWFEHRQVHKTYEALTQTLMKNPKTNEPMEWRSNLLRGKRRTYESPHGAQAITRAHCLGLTEFAGKQALRWRLEPQTGRPHQLRFELSHHGHPILGDELYGSTAAYIDSTIALRAVKLDFSDCPDALSKFELPAVIEVSGLTKASRV
jgi:tRNA pseudouridine32 synthase/23S rRNA pseudouridine746 synthase